MGFEVIYSVSSGIHAAKGNDYYWLGTAGQIVDCSKVLVEIADDSDLLKREWIPTVRSASLGLLVSERSWLFIGLSEARR